MQPLTLLRDEESEFREAVRTFAEERVRPRIDAMEAAEAIDPALVKELFELGVMGIEIPAELGGSGSSFFMAILAVEELSRVDPSVGVFVDVQNTLVNNAVLRWATPEQKARYCPRLAADTVGAYSLSEPHSGSDAFALRTRAVLARDGYRLTGRKQWTTNGAEAGLYIVFATVDPDKGHHGITGFLVERSFPGFTVGRREKKLGIRASSTCELVLEDCAVPATNVLGPIGEGYRVAAETLNEGRIAIAAQMVGLARGAFEAAIGHARERRQFGRPIAEFQAVQFDLARMATEIETARLLVYNAARLREARAPFAKEAAMAKLHASAVAERVASRAVEILGGSGFTRDFPVEKLYRDAKIGKIYEGTSNMQLQTIARQLLK
jgi:butyryl-CoA dehydrogenase/short/branched chain acyl-CoA dehydrogenase